jgi:hypothetical protein
MNKKSERRRRIKLNHARLENEYQLWCSMHGCELTYWQWLHPQMRAAVIARLG